MSNLEASIKKLIRPSIGVKLFASFLSMAMLVAAFSIASSHQARLIDSNLKRVSDDLVPILVDSEVLTRALLHLAGEASLIAAQRSASPNTELSGEAQSTIISAEGMLAGSMSSLDLLLAQHFHQEWLDAKSKLAAAQVLAVQMVADGKASSNQAVAALRPLVERAGDAVQGIRALTFQALQQEQLAANDAQSRALIMHRLLIYVSLFFAIILSLLLSSRFVRPLRVLATAVKTVENGTFDICVKTEGRDEFADLGQAFNTMALTLRRTTTSRSTLDTILRTMLEPLCVLDGNRQVHLANPAWERLLARTGDGREGYDFARVWPELVELLEAYHPESAAESLNVTEIPLRVEGESKLVRVSMVSIKSLPDVGDATLVVAQDITLARASELELEDFRSRLLQASHLASLGSVSALLSHKLNQPLTVVRLLIQQAERLVEGTPLAKAKLEDALSEVEVVSTQIREVLDYSRPLDSSDQELVSLDEVVHKTAELFTRSFRDAGISLHIRGLDLLPRMLANKAQISEAIYVLLENALHAQVEGRDSVLAIQAYEERDYVTITVRDQGAGISPDLLNKVFEPFYTTKPRSKGSGIGLARLRQIATAHRGSVRLESAENVGTTAIMTFPRKIFETTTRTEATTSEGLYGLS